VVIIELLEDVDLTPYLGEHKWAIFLKPHAQRGELETVSNIFEYNYRSQGNPANRELLCNLLYFLLKTSSLDSWTEHYPTHDLPPPSFPIKDPYPPPGYAERSAVLVPLTMAMPWPEPDEENPIVSIFLFVKQIFDFFSSYNLEARTNRVFICC